MCRFIAYAGEPVVIASLVVEPQHGLLGQCRAPRFQTRTKDNPDGYGVAWYTGSGIERHRKPVPMWEDVEFLKRARSIETTGFVAAIRKATPGIALGEENTPPYVNGNWIFAHNGSVEGWVEGNDKRAREMVSDRRLGQMLGTTDSEVLFAMVLDFIDEGADAATAVQMTVAFFADSFGGYLNLVLTDGERIAATAYQNSLFVLRTERAVVIASEPYDDDDGWEQVPDKHVLDASVDGATIGQIPLVKVKP
jgi:gamma-glutamyl hercynylcysteine S-oxide hydrolase